MTDELKPAPELCGDRCDFGRVHCDRPGDHVQSAADWHEGTTTQSSTEGGQRHSIEREVTEVIRWAPESYEIPRTPKPED